MTLVCPGKSALVLSLLIFFSPFDAFAQTPTPIVRLDFFGNIDTRIAPNQSQKIVVSATAVGDGSLQFQIRGTKPSFLSGWQGKSLDCAGECVLADTLVLRPTRDDYGRYAFNLYASFVRNGLVIQERNRPIKISVTPEIMPEPPFTSGTSNLVCWSPFETDFNYELFKTFNVNSPTPRRTIDLHLARTNLDSCDVAEGLPEGVEIEYFVEAENPSTGEVFVSNRVHSTQDQTPPDRVEIANFSVDASGDVTLRWRPTLDNESYVEKFVIERRQVKPIQVPFAVINTLSFFPVGGIAPQNYFPAITRKHERLYVDSEIRIESFPDVLKGTAFIKAASEDRWNSSEDFMSFDLLVPARVIVGIDNRAKPHPDWLVAEYSFLLNQQVRTDRDDLPRLDLFQSQELQPGRVTLGGNFADGASVPDFAELMYVIFIKPLDSEQPYLMTDVVRFTDPLGVENDLNTYKYKVNVVDAAGNVSEGITSASIILDLQGKCKPVARNWFTFENEAGHKFSQGFHNSACVQDPTQTIDCQGFWDSDSMRFQAVRENVNLFGDQEPSDLGVRFFASGWIATTDLNDGFCHKFNLSKTGIDSNFVNGSTYYYRTQSKDVHGNTSVWSDTVFAVQDIFAPNDITDLSVESTKFDDGHNGCNLLTWAAAKELVSGIRSYIVYRKGQRDLSFTAIDTVDGAQTTYCDTLADIGANEIVSYRIGSMDNVGNLRTADQTSRTVHIRALVGPIIEVDRTRFVDCPEGVLGLDGDIFTISWSGFNNAELQGYEIERRFPDGDVQVAVIDPSSMSYVVRLGEDGFYRVRIRGIYPNRETTIYSNPITVRKKVALDAVADLVAIQDSTSGDITLRWSHVEPEEIVEYQLFRWVQGEQQPERPTQIISRDVNEWTIDFQDNSLQTYECNFFVIQPIDCFGFTPASNPVVTQFAKKPPIFDRQRTVVTNTSVTVCWDRPENHLAAAENFESIVLVYRDSINTPPIDSVRFFKKTCFTLFNPLPMHNYLFRVQEVVLDQLNQSCAQALVSPYSESLIVPFENLPDPVNFTVQPLPVHPNSTSGSIFVAWEMPAEDVESFVLRWASADLPPRLDSLVVLDADTALIANLSIASAYDISLIAVDSLQQRSLVIQMPRVAFEPRWQFTPRMARFQPRCFGDSVDISWDWVEQDLTISDGRFGADSIIVQLSLDPNFAFQSTSTRLPAGPGHRFTRDSAYPFASQQNQEVHARIRAKDRWGHLSPWSTEYVELGLLSGRYDPIPPDIVSLSVDSVKAPVFGMPGEVDVHLTWPDVEDNCSGTWYYEIVRNGAVIARDTSRVASHRYIDRNLTVDKDFLELSWQVHAVDSLLNRQNTAPAVSVLFTIAAPDSGWCANDSTFCWLPAQSEGLDLPFVYFVEGARFTALFGNPLTNVIAGPLDSLCFEFDVPWEQIFWRVKARVINIESAWSDTFACELNPKSFSRITEVREESSTPLPTIYNLYQNYPNPFNPTTKIRYTIPEYERDGVDVLVQIYNLNGQNVRSFDEGVKPPGEYSVTWDARDDLGNPVGSGLYIYRLHVRNLILSRKMIFVK